MEDEVKPMARVHHLYFIGTFLQAKVNNRVFAKLDSKYAEYFPELSNYSGRSLILLKSVYSMTETGKLTSDEVK